MEYLTLYKGNLIRLNTYNKRHFDEFIKKLKSRKKIGIVDILYRGIKSDDIFYKLSIINTTFTKYADLANKLFMVGEKAKYFLHEIVEINPEDISSDLFEKIFEFLGNKEWSNIDYYIQQNESFFDFFSNRKNKSEFIKLINSKNKHIKISIRNYYLTLLHQLSCAKYKEKSFHVSTTKDFNQAKIFSNNGIVLFSWKIKSLQIKYDDIPVCEELPFEDEKENTEYRGIFPHYIYGFQILKDDVFVVNHNLFSKFNRNIEEVIKRGILFNQSKFNEVLSKTKYKKYFSS